MCSVPFFAQYYQIAKACIYSTQPIKSIPALHYSYPKCELELRLLSAILSAVPQLIPEFDSKAKKVKNSSQWQRLLFNLINGVMAYVTEIVGLDTLARIRIHNNIL
jgi:hypothetical protein